MRVTFETDCPHCHERIVYQSYLVENLSSANPLALKVPCDCGATVRFEVTLSIAGRGYERPTTEEAQG